MPDETIFCPACNRKLRVPEQELGQVVQCPLCRAVFTAPIRASSFLPEVLPVHPQPAAATSPVQAPVFPGVQPPLPPPERAAVAPTQPEEAAEPDGGPRTPEEAAAAEDMARLRELQRVLLVPAMGLLMSGMFGIFVAVREWSNCWSLGPHGLAAEAEKQRQALPEFLGQWLTPPTPIAPEMQFYVHLGAISCLLFAAFGVVLGAVQMLRLRNYWLAVLGCCLAFCNCGSLCFSAPFGLWSLLVLRNPDVRDAFG